MIMLKVILWITAQNYLLDEHFYCLLIFDVV